MTDLLIELEQAGSITKLAAKYKVSRSTMTKRLNRVKTAAATNNGDDGTPEEVQGAKIPKITKAVIEDAIRPFNGCKVKVFRDMLDSQSQKNLDEMFRHNRRDLPTPRIREELLKIGFEDSIMPSVDALNAHRRKERPCRCSDD